MLIKGTLLVVLTSGLSLLVSISVTSLVTELVGVDSGVGVIV